MSFVRNSKSQLGENRLRPPPVGLWAELDPALRHAWTGFLKAHAVLTRVLDGELQAEHGLSLSEYDVLIQLQMAACPVQMHVLAHAVVLSRGGLTRCVGGLENRGLVIRSRGEHDVRHVFAQLTDHGAALLEQATSTHLSGVSRLFEAPLSRSDFINLASAWQSLLGDTTTLTPHLDTDSNTPT